MALLKLFTLLILVTWPLGELFRLQFGTVAIKPLDVAVILTTVTYIFFVVLKKIPFNTRYAKWIILFALVGLVSLCINSMWLQTNEIAVSFLYLLRWTAYALLLNVILQFDKGFKLTVTKILVVEGLIILLVGYLQLFFYPDLRNLFYLGWDEHLYRMFSVFLDPNFAGSFFVLYFIFVAGLLYSHIINRHSGLSRISNVYSGKRFWMHLRFTRMTVIIILSIILSLTLIAIFLTFSRSALLMLISGAAVFLVLIKQKKLMFFLIGAIGIAVLLISPFFYIENTNLFRVNSSKARVETTLSALQIIHDRPILGVGFNTYRYAQQMYGFRSEKPLVPSHADAGVDNSFLFVLATTGVIGFVAYLLFWSTILKRAYYLSRKKHNINATIVLASTAGLFVNALFINSLFFPSIIVWMIVLVGMMED